MFVIANLEQKAAYRAGIERVLAMLTDVVEQNQDSENIGKVMPGLEIAGQVCRMAYPGYAVAPCPEWLKPIERECGNRFYEEAM